MNIALPIPVLKIKEGDICAEIGVWKGQNASGILERKPRKLHLIDPWVHQDYEGRWYEIKQVEMDEIYKDVCNKFKGDNRVNIHRKFSTDAAFPNEYFNWVYIDGNHSYDAVLEDLNHYYPLIKKGGLLCGDDYGWKDKHCDKGPKVAVDEFVKINNLKLEIYSRWQRPSTISRGNQFIITL